MENESNTLHKIEEEQGACGGKVPSIAYMPLVMSGSPPYQEPEFLFILGLGLCSGPFYEAEQ